MAEQGGTRARAGAATWPAGGARRGAGSASIPRETSGVGCLSSGSLSLASPCGSAPERGSAPGDDPTGCVWVPARTGGDPRGARSGADG